MLADVLWELMIKELDAANGYPANDDGRVGFPHSAAATAITNRNGCCFWQRGWMQIVHHIFRVIFTRVQMIQVGSYCMTMNWTDVA